MTGRAWLWLLLLPIAGCSGPVSPPITMTTIGPPACRVGPDGARPVAERGMGGTGATSVQGPAIEPERRLAERGMGGTGARARHVPPDLHLEMRSAERGMGGTGIIGVVTGFGSLCVAGERVALPSGVEVRIDDQPGDLDRLRAGQVTAVTAYIESGKLSARAIDVIHLVVGPIESVEPGSMLVAGQKVILDGASGAATAAKPGAWVAVSGLRKPDGGILATRVDPASSGTVLVRGELTRISGATLIGRLGVRLPGGPQVPGGWSVVATGRLQGGTLIVDQAKLDVSANSPTDYFGPSIARYVLEGFVTAVPGGIMIDHTFVAGSDLGVAGLGGRRIVSFRRGANGDLSMITPDIGTQPAPSRRDLFSTPPPEMSLSPGAGGSGDDDQPSRPAPAKKH